TNAASLEAPGNGSLWVVQVLGAMLFFLAGFAKLSGDEQMVETFAAIGIGQWFRYVTGLIEVVSAILLLIPTLSGIIAVLAVPMMIGVILTQLLIITSIVAWGRKETTLRLIRRNDPKSVRQATNAFSEVS